MINNTGSIELSHSFGRPHTAHTKANISKAKCHLNLDCFPYKIIKQSKLINIQQQKGVKFAIWVLNSYTKNDTKRWLFTDEKVFD